MIRKMISETELSKEDRRKFIPFVNERNHMGEIIKNKQKDKQFLRSLQVFENLKKTTKEYLFDKKYQKMKQKLSRSQLSLHPKQPNYDKQIKSCLKSLQKSNIFKPNNTNINDSNIFYVDLNEKLSQNICTLKSEIQNKHINRLLSTKKSDEKFKTFHDNGLKNSKLTDFSSSVVRKFASNKENNHINTQIRQKAMTSPNEKNILVQSQILGSRKREIFGEISKQSEKMVDFTNCGMKYRHMVETEKKDPWKKWYVNQNVEIFPGEVVKVKKLQKSIY